jgi:hypothetical protein
MIQLRELIGFPNLEWHIKEGKSISDNIYRYSSESFISLFEEARRGLNEGRVKLSSEDEQLIRETDIGLYGVFEGIKVPLDIPMEEVGDIINCKKCSHSWKIEANDEGSGLCHKCGYDNDSNSYDMKALEDWKSLNESEYKGKKVSLNKPKRGGTKKFYVYTKNPKTGKVIKVSFGAEGGGQNLAVKFKEPGARASFAARHNCSTKNDKTKPGYWSCRLPRYWKQLGGDKNYSGFW